MTKAEHRPSGRAEPRLRAIYSTIREDDIARAIEATYPLGSVEACHFIRRGFNDVYALRVQVGGRRYVARAGRSAHPRRAEDVAYANRSSSIT